MDISLLNKRVVFEQRRVVRDEIGNEQETWRVFYSCYATVSGEGGREAFKAGQVSARFDAALTVRCCQAVKRITSTGFRVVFDGEVFDIVGIDHMAYRGRAYKFYVTKEREGPGG